MGKGCRFLRTVIFTLVIMRVIRHNNMVSTTGRAEHFTEDSSYLEWDMVKESGKCCMGILMKVNTWTIRKMDKAFIIGKMDQNTLVPSKMTTVMGMERCSGMMVAFIKGNGSMGLKKMLPSNLIMALIKWAELKVLSIQYQLLQDRKRLQFQKDTTFPLFKRNKWDQYQIRVRKTLSKQQTHPCL